MNRNPITQLKAEEQITIGGEGSRDGRNLAALFATPSMTSDNRNLKQFPVSKGRQEMFAATVHHTGRTVIGGTGSFQAEREGLLDTLLQPGVVLVAMTTTNYMTGEFHDQLVHELRYGKVERHPRKALKSFNKASKAMARQFRNDVTRDLHFPHGIFTSETIYVPQ